MLSEGGRTNLLLIGDDGAGEADVMTLVSVSIDDLVCLSIPVDVRVKDVSGELVTISSVFSDSGVALTAETVEDLLDIEVPFYLLADRASLLDWIQLAGGMSVTLEEMATYSDLTSDPSLQVEMRPGEQTLKGEDALAFAISPSLPGDIGIVARQQLVLRALLAQVFRALPERTVRSAIRESYPSMETNCSLGDLLELAGVIHGMSGTNERMVVLPTEQAVVDGQAVVEPKIVETERIIASWLKGLDLLTPDEVNVAVFNGNGVREVASRTAEYLKARGFSITRIGNADSFDYSPTYIVVLSDEEKAWVLQDALPPNEIRIVFPETFEASYAALQEFVPVGTDLLLIAGMGMILE